MKIFSSWSVEELFTGLSMALTACIKSGCKAQEGQSLCLLLTQDVLASSSAALAIVICGSSRSCLCCVWAAQCSCFSAWSAPVKLQAPPSLSRRLKWLCWCCFSHGAEALSSPGKDFLTCDLEGALTIDVRRVYVMYELFTYLLQTNDDFLRLGNGRGQTISWKMD